MKSSDILGRQSLLGDEKCQIEIVPEYYNIGLLIHSVLMEGK